MDCTTTSFGSAFRMAREATGLSRKEAGKTLFISADMVKLYEINQHVPDADLTIRMAKQCDTPELIFKRCVNCCPIGRKFRYRVLNNINRSLPAMLIKFKDEMQEIADSIDDLLITILNKNSSSDYSEFEKQRVLDMLQEIIDVSHNSDEIYIELMRIFGIETVEEGVRRHHSKCYKNGYLTDNKKLAVSQQRAFKKAL